MQNIPVHQRNFGLMFQDFALFPHKNVWDNVIFGLRMQNLPADQIQQLGQAALDMVGLSGFEKRDVHQLSGGERQRVALARSLAPKPKLLMLDEPLGALDRQLREELMIELRRILKAAHLTSIYVTHDQAEAFAVADRVAVMNAGRIEQIDTPASRLCAARVRIRRALSGHAECDQWHGVELLRRNVAVVNTPIGLLHVTTDRSLQPDQAGDAAHSIGGRHDRTRSVCGRVGRMVCRNAAGQRTARHVARRFLSRTLLSAWSSAGTTSILNLKLKPVTACHRSDSLLRFLYRPTPSV